MIEFGVLGPLMIRTNRGAVTLPSPKQRALLAVLVLEVPADVVGSERLIDELWGEDPPSTANKALQVHVSQLRRALGGEQPVVTRPTGYALEIDPQAIDIRRFDTLLAQGRKLRATGDTAGALRSQQQALSLWRGRALADVTLLGQSATEADRLDGLRALAQEELMELELARGGAAALVPDLEALVAAYPYRERMHGLLMLALYRSGRQADALDAFRRARAVLVEELGIEPGADLVRLEGAILAQDPALEAGPGPAAGTSAPASATSAPAVADRTPIPRAASAILGRQAELDRAQAMLERADVRLLTLTGTGGIGKTRLSLELATRVGEPARFVELVAITDPRRVLPAIATAVNATDPNEDAIAAVLEGVGGAVLFLDNFEQVLEAAPSVASLLSRTADLRIVVTSRAPLRIAGEHELPVPPLRRDPAVELFLSRVRERDPEFAPDAGELEAIAEICGRVDGLPLAIELAAARTRVLAPGTLLERLGQRLDVLTGGRRDAPERHRALRATIAWSHDLLSEAERRVFAELAVFRAGCSLEACETVVTDHVLDPLSALVDHALVIRDGQRFTMLETVREYATERLSEMPEANAVRRRHARWCAALAESVEPELEGHEQTTSFARLDAEQENLRAASAWGVAAGEPEIALQIGGSLWRYWLARVGAEEIRDTLRAAVASGAGQPALRTKALNAAGVLAGATDDFDTARACFEEAVELGRATGERRQMARALGNLGVLAWFARDSASARELYREAADIWDELGDVRGQSLMRQNLAIVLQDTGEIELAVTMLEESVELARVAGNQMQIAATLCTLGRVLVFRRPEDSRVPTLLGEALELSAALGERLRTAECLELVAHFAAGAGKAMVGAELIGAADAERSRAGAERKPDELPYFDQTSRRLEEILGGDTYDQARSRGRDGSLQAAVATALRCTASGVRR